MFSIKVKYNNKTKPLSKINDYQTLIRTIKNRFTQLTQPFKIHYIDKDGDKIDIENQEDYQSIDIKESSTLIIFISNQLECKKLTKIQTSNNQRNENLGGSVPEGTLNKKNLQQSNQVCILAEKPIFPSSKQQQINALQKSSFALTEKNKQTTDSQLKKQIVQQGTKIWRDCMICKEQFTGLKWRCTDVTCFDFDVCPKCEKEGKIQKLHKANHKFVEIKDENFISKVNFIHAINKIFDSKYDKQKQIENKEEKEWISHKDILQNSPKFINSVWNSSQSLVDKLIMNFDEWQRGYQRSQIK